eukprot:jgi/Tetstr1/431309/TSEL_021001.t1
MLAQTPEEAIERLKALMASGFASASASAPGAGGSDDSDDSEEELGERAGISESSEPRAGDERLSSTDAAQLAPLDPRSGEMPYVDHVRTSSDKPAPPPVAMPLPPEESAAAVNRELVEALLGSLEKKQRECNKAYELMQGTNVARKLMGSGLVKPPVGQAAGPGSPAPSAASPSKPVRRRGGKAAGARRSQRGAGAAGPGETDSLEGKVISQLLKQAQEGDAANKEMQQKYRKSLDDIAACRKKLRSAEAQCAALQQQVHDHRDNEVKLRQRMSELRIKSSKQSGKENKVQEDLQTLRQQLATEKGEHDLTKQRLLGMLRTQRASKESVLANRSIEVEREKARAESLMQQLAETQQRLSETSSENGKLTELIEHKTMQLNAVVSQLQEERRVREKERSDTDRKSRHAADIMTAARDAVEAAESFSARLKDQNASIVALKAERDHAKASLVHLRTELEEARSKAESERVKDSQPYRRLQMLEEDIATVSETLEGAVGGGISNAADGDALHRLRTASDAVLRELDASRRRVQQEQHERAVALAAKQEELTSLRSNVLHLKGQLALEGAQAKERESGLRQRLRRAEADRDECLAAAGRADALLARFTSRDSSINESMNASLVSHRQP